MVQNLKFPVPYRPIPFEGVLTILVSTFNLIRDERKRERERASCVKGEKGE